MTVHYFKSLKVTTHTFVWTQKMPSTNKVYRTCLILIYRNTGTDIVVCVLQLLSAGFQEHPLFFRVSTDLVGLGLLFIEASR